MTKYNRLVYFFGYILIQNYIFKVFAIVACVASLSMQILFKSTNSQLSLRYIPEELHELFLKGVFPGAIPILLGLYLMLCIVFVEVLFKSEQVKILLSKAYKRAYIFNLHVVTLLIVVMISTLFFYLSVFQFYTISLNNLVNLVTLQIVIYLQVLFLNSIKVGKNAILLIYISGFIFLPLFINEILIALLRDSINSPLIVKGIEYFFDFLSISVDLSSNFGAFLEFKTLSIILVMYGTSLIIFNRKEFY